MSTYRQTDNTTLFADDNNHRCNPLTGTSADIRLVISAGAAAGTISRSNTLVSSGFQRSPIYFFTAKGVPGTASWVGACTMRLNVTTANSNITWYGLSFCSICENSASRDTLTITSGLSIGLGTTGVKTASVEATTITTILCDTSSSAAAFGLNMSNAAAMNASFNWVSDQLVDLPFTSTAAPSTAPIPSLALMNVGT